MTKLLPYQKASSSLSQKEKIGQFFMPAAFINDTEEEIQELEHLIKDQGVGGLCFFHSRASAATNFEGKKKVVRNEQGFETLQKLIQRYQNAAKYPLLIAIDAEWGLAMRIENTPQYPYAITLGALQDKEELITQVGRNIAKDCKAAGIHWNLVPCIDINNNPLNPVIGYRSFGEDKMQVSKKAIAFVKGIQSEGILTSIKHFPGHGDTATDSHLGLPLIEKSKQDLFANELFPFQKLIAEGIDSVMVGHLAVPALAGGKKISSSISKDSIKGVLRNEMGFNGVVISDALNMHAVSKNYPIKGELEWLAFDAGNDVLCFVEEVAAGITQIDVKASTSQIEESFQRIWSLKEKAFLNNPEQSAQLETDSELNRQIAEHALTLVKGSEASISRFRYSNYCTLKINRLDQDTNIILEQLETHKHAAAEHENVLVLLTPPQIKPTNCFGLLPEEINFINELIQTKNVLLYLFGNPYVLNHLNSTKAIAVIVAYQNFPEFQEAAKAHFLGKIEALGRLPVSVLTNT